MAAWLLVAAALAAACGSSQAAPRGGVPPQASAVVQRLSPAQLAGQRVIYSYRGLVPPPSLLAAIRAGDAAGVIFFGANISSVAQITEVIAQLQRAAAQSPIKEPLLLMTDQEGGLVRRLPGAPALSEQQIGAGAHPSAAAQQAGRDAALNLRSIGMNVNLAPVLDVARASDGFIGRYGRSYGRVAGAVAQLGAAFVRAQQGHGVAATAKHFPGLGAAAAWQNTDLEPVTLRVPLATLRAVDENPYGPAIAAGVRLVMVSWATYPGLDARRPAGLSSAVVQGELRRRLGFGGVTITDALEAGALRAFGGTSSRAVLAAGAGMDLILCAGQSVGQGASAESALAGALRSGRLGRAAFTTSVERVLALRAAAPA
jgi:beta-N-acetylhexosaminidase